MIDNYSDFIIDRLISESIIYFSPALRLKLGKMNHDVSREILSAELSNIKDDITFIDIDEDGYVSYNTMKNAVVALKNKYPHTINAIEKDGSTNLSDQIYAVDKSGNESTETGIYSKSRSRIKFGRLINKILPGKFKPNEIEEFSNKWKSLLENSREKISIVDGDDIAYWYAGDRYESQKGSLGNSCMRGSRGIFDIYTKNPEVCKMVIITENDKLLSRAIIWKVSKKSLGTWEWFMDRQYTVSDEYVDKLRNYAIEQNWSYKTNNNHHSLNTVSWIAGTVLINKEVEMEVQLKPYDKDSYRYANYPYVDTFRRYDPSTGKLFNDDDDSIDGNYILNDTDGGYTECTEGVYSEYYDERIPEGEYVYSEMVNSYIWLDRSIEVSRGSVRYRGYYPEGWDDIVYDEWNEEYIHSNDAVWSEAYQYYILSSDSESAIYKIDVDGEPNSNEHYIHSDDSDYIDISEFSNMKWYKKVLVDYRDWEDGYTHTKISKDLLKKDLDGNWIPIVFSSKVYKIKAPSDIPYLSKIDAEILEIEIDLDNPINIDNYRYNNDIKEIYPDILIKSKSKLEALKSQEDQNSKTDRLKNSIVIRIEDIENENWVDWKDEA